MGIDFPETSDLEQISRSIKIKHLCKIRNQAGWSLLDSDNCIDVLYDSNGRVVSIIEVFE